MPALLAVLLALAPSAARAFDDAGHAQITREALGGPGGFGAEELDDVVAGNLEVDRDQPESAAHFDSERFAAGSARLVENLEAALRALDLCDGGTARKRLGRALHAVQDFFSHANWVENHAPEEAVDLFALADPAPETACDAELRRGPLTSGYWPDDRRPAPHKCVHAELNKDNPKRRFHVEARARAVRESRAVAEMLRSAAPKAPLRRRGECVMDERMGRRKTSALPWR